MHQNTIVLKIIFESNIVELNKRCTASTRRKNECAKCNAMQKPIVAYLVLPVASCEFG